MNVQALRRAAQKNGKSLSTKSTNPGTALTQLKKWGTSGQGSEQRR